MIRRLLIVAGLASAAACGGSPQSQADDAAKQVERGAKQMQQGAQQVARGAEQGSAQMAQGLQQMAQGMQQLTQGSTTAVQFESLVALLPEMAGWKRGEPRGEQHSTPMASSRAEARYEMGDSHMTIEITDTALSQLLTAPVAMFLNSGYAERSGDGFKRAAKVAGHPAMEDWNSRSKRGEVTVLVANRFLLKASGDDIASIDVARKAAESVDIGKLAALK